MFPVSCPKCNKEGIPRDLVRHQRDVPLFGDRNISIIYDSNLLIFACCIHSFLCFPDVCPFEPNVGRLPRAGGTLSFFYDWVSSKRGKIFMSLFGFTCPRHHLHTTPNTLISRRSRGATRCTNTLGRPYGVLP
jgi:hypothetical protein